MSETGVQCVRHIEASVECLTQTIDDLLHLSRIARQHLNIGRIDLTSMAQACIDELRESEPDRRVECVVHEGMSVEADGRLMKLVIDNLIGNAWKYTSKKDEARIEVGER